MAAREDKAEGLKSGGRRVASTVPQTGSDPQNPTVQNAERRGSSFAGRHGEQRGEISR